jgi:hypothetical protein
MASFPDAVKSFTTKLDGAGNNINAAHVNDLQDEVTAIESGYLTGTARLQSSAAIVNTLQVNGGSTLATRPVMGPPNVAVVYTPSTIAVSSVTSTQSWLQQSILTNSSMHSTVTFPERLTPQSTGVYRATAQYRIDGVGDTNVVVEVTILDSSAGEVAQQRHLLSSITNMVLSATGLKRFDQVGGHLTVQFARGASTMSLSSGVGRTWFALEKL